MSFDLPNKFDQIMFVRQRQAGVEHGRGGVGATIYFGSPVGPPDRRVSQTFQAAHESGMATVLWCYLRNEAFTTRKGLPPVGRPHRPGQPPGRDRGRHHQAEAADPQLGGYKALATKVSPYGKTHPEVYTGCRATTPSTCAATRSPTATWAAPVFINSGAPRAVSDWAEPARTAVINKRAGGMGLISGRKAFQRPLKEGISITPRRSGRVSGQKITIA